jgi:hypothetical protein
MYNHAAGFVANPAAWLPQGVYLLCRLFGKLKRKMLWLRGQILFGTGNNQHVPAAA